MAYRAGNNPEIFQIGFIMVYVKGDLDEETFMEQADHLIYQKHPDYVYNLQRSLYGLKQAGMPHWKAAKRVLKYLKGTRNRDLAFRPTKRPLVGFADSDWVSDITDRKYYSG
ncbi:hypothetical protein AVEN_2327-1 [Araneus ventricosus]|uniref:Reverse transcriptase Ty1/copia-type domain-containing protein n=1 Tax=Araneus ventricosus TaxID=182803 RepID=A0A4Y2VBS9_ARAVE|nr:hypothetical protein AVEN_2327-1 [Araneus ventricosus]